MNSGVKCIGTKQCVLIRDSGRGCPDFRASTFRGSTVQYSWNLSIMVTLGPTKSGCYRVGDLLIIQ